MSGEEFRTITGGSSSSCYSTPSSNSSSVENISTSSSIENGDQLTITFVPRKSPRCLSPFLDDVFSIDDICLEDRVSPVQKPLFRGSPSWYSDITNGVVSPSPRTVTNNDECSSISGYSQVVQQLSRDGILLKSLEKGAAFPYLHLSTSGPLCVSPSCFTEDSGDSKQGVYKEIKRVIPPDSWMKLDSHQSQGKPTWLFLGFKTLDKNNDAIEQSWKEWTGVRHLYLELRTDIHIRRISFFRRRDPLDCLDTFTYVVFIEIGAVSEKTHTWLLDFVQRTRLERMQNTMTVYEEIEFWDTDSGIPHV